MHIMRLTTGHAKTCAGQDVVAYCCLMLVQATLEGANAAPDDSAAKRISLKRLPDWAEYCSQKPGSLCNVGDKIGRNTMTSALVTGTNSGIGFATVLALSSTGH